ncbi:hypothetical protein Tco_1234468 [Tanacetum coccineum]
MSYDEIRPIFEMVWDQVNTFVPIGFEIETEVIKKSRFEFQQEPLQPIKEEKVGEEKVKEEKVEKDVKPEITMTQSSIKSGGRKRKTIAKKIVRKAQADEESSKTQKLDDEEAADYEQEKEQLRMWLTVVPDEEAIMDPKILHTKYPIVD